jgi:hypothetical protein
VQFRCIDDYDLSSRSPAYFVAARALVVFGKLLPSRLRGNTLLFVLEKSEG